MSLVLVPLGRLATGRRLTARPGGVAIADDDQLLPAGAFDLEPGPATSGAVGGVTPLRDDALEAEAGGLGEEFRSAAAVMVAVFDRAASAGEQRRQGGLALLLRHAPQIVPVEMEEVEDEIDEAAGLAVRQRPLQSGKAGAAARLDRGDLAVEDGVARRPPGQRLGDLGKALRPIEPIAGLQRRAPVCEPGEDAIAVELDLVQPVVALRRRGCGTRELHRDLGRWARAPRPRQRRDVDLGLWWRHLAVLAVPDAIGGAGDRRDVAPAGDAGRRRLGHRGAAARPCFGIALLDEEPVLTLLRRRLAAHPHEGPSAVQLLALEGEFHRAAAVRCRGVALLGAPGAAVPQHDGAAAVLTLRDDAFEAAVFERVILDMHRQALLAGIEARPFRDRPALEHAVELEAKIVMQAPRRMLLDDEAQGRGGRLRRARAGCRTARLPALRRTRWFRGSLEVALAPILLETHGLSCRVGRAAIVRSTEATSGNGTLPSRFRFWSSSDV